MKYSIFTSLIAICILFAVTSPAVTSESPLLEKEGFPLFMTYPGLQGKISRVKILEGSTPLVPMLELEKKLFSDANMPSPQEPLLWVKQDDNSSEELGGNKARKLEFLLAKAVEQKAKKLVTCGMDGSNHALAVAIAGRRFGFEVELILGPQPLTENVKQKLLAFHALGAKIHFHNFRIGMGLEMAGYSLWNKFQKDTLYIPPGGSNEIGDLGYVNAFLELVDQVGIEGLPDQIVLPLGSMGTTAGLLVGSCLAGAWEKVKIIGVNVADPMFTTDSATRKQAQKVYNFIRKKLDSASNPLPECDFAHSKKAFEFVKSYYAPEYGASVPAVHEDMALLERTENMILDGTYSGKAMHYYLDTVRSTLAAGKTPPKMLFWLTYSAYDLNKFIDAHTWTNPEKKWLDLPKSIWKLFE